MGMKYGLALPALFVLCLTCACSDSSGDKACQTDRDCLSGDQCIDGMCFHGSPDGETQSDGESDGGLDASDAPTDTGGDDQPDAGPDADGPAGDEFRDGGADEGGDRPQPPAYWILPGQGLGEMEVSQGMDQVHTLQAVQTTLAEDGAACDAGEFTLAFLQDSIRATGIESNENDLFDASDPVIALTVRTGLDARTADGVAPGSTLDEVLALAAWAHPDHLSSLPEGGAYGGGRLALYFGQGLFVNFDSSDVATAIIVTRPLVPSTGTIDPVAGTLQMNGQTLVCGDGLNGTYRSEFRGWLGMPDWAYSFTREVQTSDGPTDMQFFIDSYRIMGLEFIGAELFVDPLIAVVMVPLFYGTTAAGHGIGSSKAEWETELGQPADAKHDPAYDGTLYVYTAGTRSFGVVYANDGQEPTDQATLLVLNYLSASE